MFNVEDFWAQILSEEPDLIRTAYLALPTEDEREAIYEHLQAMISEDGYADVQRESASAALKVIETLR